LLNLTFNQNLQGQEFYQAGSTITNTSLVNSATGTVVNIKAGAQLNLKDGFAARASTEFREYVAPSNNDVPLRIGQANKRLAAKNSVPNRIKNKKMTTIKKKSIK
jgi:hypothetical protein